MHFTLSHAQTHTHTDTETHTHTHTHTDTETEAHTHTRLHTHTHTHTRRLSVCRYGDASGVLECKVCPDLCHIKYQNLPQFYWAILQACKHGQVNPTYTKAYLSSETWQGIFAFPH